MAKAGSAVAEKQKTEVALPSASSVPDFLRRDGPLKGNENVGARDLTIPRIMLLQALSPELDQNEAKFIPGARAGQFCNSLTHELYDVLHISDIYYVKEWGIFVKRTSGGGFRGNAKTEVDAIQKVEELLATKREDLEVIETGIHFCLLHHEDGRTPEEIALYMTSTKLKVSRNLNSMIRLVPTDRWAARWRLVPVQESNAKGKYYNISVSRDTETPWVTTDINKKCEEIYDLIIAGNRTVDRGDDREESASDKESRF